MATKPCRHLLLNGECRRSDCAFSHDFATTTCRFWLQGECINSAESCHFLHDLDVPVPDTAGVCLHLDGDSPVPRTRWAREGDTGGGAGEWTPARGSDSFSDATADHFVNGGGDGVGGGRAPKTEEFPVLESKNASPSTKTSIVSGGVGDDQQNSRLQNPAAADTAGRTTGEVGGEGESEDEDELLAAVLVATRGGAGGGTDGKNNGSRRKVGRGRKVGLHLGCRERASPLGAETALLFVVFDWAGSVVWCWALNSMRSYCTHAGQDVIRMYLVRFVSRVSPLTGEYMERHCALQAQRSRHPRRSTLASLGDTIDACV